MTKNVGTPDRLIRIAVAAVIAILILTGAVQGALAVILGVVAVVFALTSLIGMCPLYSLFGISTCPRRAN